MKKIILTDIEPEFNINSDELAKIVTARLGLLPRKRGSNDKMHKILLELYERTKKATKEKDLKLAVMTVEDMAFFAGISKQTMYDYINRWLDIDLIIKISFIDSNNKKVIGYRLNGSNLEEAFMKVEKVIKKNLNLTSKYISELQRIIKNEKIKESMKKK